MQYVDFEDAQALDLFSGTGSISLELVSRGCKQVVSVEMDRDHHRFIQECLKKLNTDKCVPIRGDVFRFLKSCRQQYDFIFADPPYALKELPQIPDIIFERQLLKEEGLFVFEHGKDYDFSAHPHFLEHRSYGSVNFTLFTAKERADG
jgi:16S rRNA (guanine(966)-N(2))-methyltransferase RsmD